MSGTPHRYAIVGTGSRATMYVDAITERGDRAALVALADPNPKRIAHHAAAVQAAGLPSPAAYDAAAFERLLTETDPDTVIVTSVDATHHEYILAALAAGKDVISEKPLTTTAEHAAAILAAERESAGKVTVTFNYRYNPLHEKVAELLRDGAVGEITSVGFDWLLDTRHGADYFRRWHREEANSGGLLVHKSGHHFDLVNWWLDAAPVRAFAKGKLAFYGENGKANGHDRGYERVHGSSLASDDPFALHLEENPTLKALYLDAEDADGYVRDQSVFAPGVTIYDDMMALVDYDSGVTLSYRLTAYSPWEGYRVHFNGTQGRLELLVVENDHVNPALKGPNGASVHGTHAAAEEGRYELTLHPFWTKPTRIDLGEYHRAGHGGGDARMLGVLLDGDTDPHDRSASARDGVNALAAGLASNASIRTGQSVAVSDLFNLEK
ncbi:Gfo/Idh/MocA family oxidoreductase [Glycomyces terrestris]|uniref:Gfo/Idh/MocA family oxidoreductase n=1 Tax=Glycomyces terrestris TaxID=2493553 RepID=A0A426V5J3_9ACTN|nr:Gfo/Idh/MocA family oxidoreductase [Glycomyces terrestris]RRS02101.1 gfo/Idh/MocA family oxidoreductase [Glycomyces terrestris]